MPGQAPPVQNTDPDTQQKAADMAEALLRSKNIKEFKSTLTCAGLLCFPNGVAIQSGINVNFINKGLFNGKWIIQKETLHISDNKFVADIEFRKCIDPVNPSNPVTEVENNPADSDPDPDVPVT